MIPPMGSQGAAGIAWSCALAFVVVAGFAVAQVGCDGRPLPIGDGAGTGGSFVIGAGGSGVGGSVLGAGGSGVGGSVLGAGGSGVGGAGAGGRGAGGSGAGGAIPGCDSNCLTGEMCAGGICRGPNSRWTTLGGDVHHSGFNVNETGGPPTALAWQAALTQATLWPVVSDGTTVYASASSASSQTGLSALSATDGSKVWSYDFGNVFSVGQPTIDDLHVYIAQCNNYMGTYMYSFYSSDGPNMLAWLTSFNAQWELYWAPLVAPNGRIYFDGGTYGGLYGLDVTSGAQSFFNSSLEQEDQWSPLLLNGMIYTAVGGKLRAHDPTTGTTLSTVTISPNPPGASTPVSDGDKIYVIVSPNLYAFRTGQTTPTWTASASFTGMPAVANGVVYAISDRQLHAINATSGAELWTFPGDGQLGYPPAVAGDYVYVAGRSTAYALKVSTQAAAWKAPGGWLSIAGGKLYVAQPNGTLSAYTLGH
jgi:outer membrane protein assembly factor BamB